MFSLKIHAVITNFLKTLLIYKSTQTIIPVILFFLKTWLLVFFCFIFNIEKPLVWIFYVFVLSASNSYNYINNPLQNICILENFPTTYFLLFLYLKTYVWFSLSLLIVILIINNLFNKYTKWINNRWL